jgi:hypothetical protein
MSNITKTRGVWPADVSPRRLESRDLSYKLSSADFGSILPDKLTWSRNLGNIKSTGPAGEELSSKCFDSCGANPERPRTVVFDADGKDWIA